MHAPRKEVWHKRLERSGYLVGAILLHLIVFLLVATFVIWKAPEPPPATEFSAARVKLPPPPPPAPPSSGAEAPNPELEPDTVVVPVPTPPSVITTDNSAFNIDASKAIKAALNNLPARGTGLSTGSGGSSGSGSDYGSSDGGVAGFQGTIYDLKQTPDRKPTEIAENDVELHSDFDPNWFTAPATLKGLEVLRAFVKTWNTSLLSDYYKGPSNLTTSQICIPVHPSVDAPKAFGVDGIVRARRWIILYHAKVTPPDSGRYRFIGLGDDFLFVRYDGQNVFDGSLVGEDLDPTVDTKDDVGMCPGYGPYRCGQWVQMAGGLSVDMDVLIGEGPGGASGFILMIQKEGDDSAKGDYPVFQLAPTPIPTGPIVPPSRKSILFQSK